MVDKFMKGVPPLCFLPARNFIFKITDENYVVELPRRGNYHDLDPEFFSEEDGSFDMFADNKLLFTPALTKVLFAAKKYPDLKFNQFFVPFVIKFEEDTVKLVGQIVDMMIQMDETAEDKTDEEE